jgi:carbamoylphosphate synthase small subunit
MLTLLLVLRCVFVLQVLRETGCLNGVLCTDASKTDEELVAMTKNWTIVGQDLLKVVSTPQRSRLAIIVWPETSKGRCLQTQHSCLLAVCSRTMSCCAAVCAGELH